MATCWLFPENRARRWEGINDGDAQHFLKNPIGSLAREIIQNSIDARISDQPVEVDFELISIKRTNFPNIDELTDKLKKSLETQKNNDNRTQRFLSDAFELCQKDEIEILKISEKNTTGMAGPPDDYDSPFYAYTRGSGLTGKTDGLGSFGIGKKAPVVNSSLRTIFVSTQFNDKKFGPSNLCQGMSYWVTHKENDLLYDGTGFWGVREGNPVTENQNLPDWLNREQLGTSIYITAPTLSKNWQEILAGAVLTNFFASIHDDKLNIRAGGYVLNKDTIRTVFEDEKIRIAIANLEDEQYLEAYTNASYFYKAYSSEKAINEEIIGPGELGKFSLKLLVEEELPKQIGFIRNGMYIVSNDLPSLRKFQNTKDFIAVAQCLDPRGNSILREMEPPQHNAFEPNRYNPTTGPGLLKALGKKIRETLLKHIQPDATDVANVDFLSDLLGIENNFSQNTDGPAELNPDGRIIHKFKTISQNILKPKSTLEKQMGEDGPSDPVGEKTNTKSGGLLSNNASKPGTREDSGVDGGSGDRPLGVEKLVLNPRVIYKNDGSLQTFFAVDYKGDVLIRFYIAGAESDELAKVEYTSIGERVNGGVRLTKIKGAAERLEFKVRLENVTNEALIITAYEI